MVKVRGMVGQAEDTVVQRPAHSGKVAQEEKWLAAQWQVKSEVGNILLQGSESHSLQPEFAGAQRGDPLGR